MTGSSHIALQMTVCVVYPNYQGNWKWCWVRRNHEEIVMRGPDASSAVNSRIDSCSASHNFFRFFFFFSLKKNPFHYFASELQWFLKQGRFSTIHLIRGGLDLIVLWSFPFSLYPHDVQTATRTESTHVRVLALTLSYSCVSSDLKRKGESVLCNDLDVLHIRCSLPAAGSTYFFVWLFFPSHFPGFFM